jgi:uncharacterized membrane protein
VTQERVVINTKVGKGMGIFLIVTGIGHFLAPAGLDKIVPSFMPGDPRLWTYLSGVAEIVIGIGLLAPLNRKLGSFSIRLLAAYAALLLFVAVYPANINMAIQWSSRPMPEPLFAYARLPLQLGLFYWAWSIIKAIKR